MSKELKKEDIINHLSGKIKLKRYEVDGFIDKYINREDRYSIVKKIAENVAAGSHIDDQIGGGKDVEPDITNEVKTQQTLEILIHAAALTLIEGIKSPHHKKPLTEKEIVDHYTNGILQTFHIEHHKAKKLLKKGIEYHVGINKERVLF